jgi:alkanesulfonate monooxygenase SsuD/methylene tetrahydromethanopterin reductase-like flavin-dependent oxidoreductase (luciferase family)
MELGLGAGWRASEQISYGLPWEPSAKARVQRLIETVEIVKGMWSNESFTYSGRYYNVKDAVCAPKPLQKPYPRIWLAGKGEKLVLKTVAKYADGWNVDEISPEEFARKLAVLHAHCRSLGTDYDRIVKSLENFVLISDKAEDLERVVSWSNWAADAQAEYGESKPVVGHLEDMETKYILGTVREVTDRVADYVKTGVQHFMMYFLDYPSTKSIRSFAREVIPSL